MLYPNSLVIDWSRLVLRQEQPKFRQNFYLERLGYWERFLKSKATCCGSISTVFSGKVLLCVSSIIITENATTSLYNHAIHQQHQNYLKDPIKQVVLTTWKYTNQRWNKIITSQRSLTKKLWKATLNVNNDCHYLDATTTFTHFNYFIIPRKQSLPYYATVMLDKPNIQGKRCTAN